jgi:hypothetical protein
MPVISQFNGITITMYYDDHNPPHFHARRADDEVLIGIQTLSVLFGSLPSKQLKSVIRWARLHQEELMDNWERVRRGELLQPINP